MACGANGAKILPVLDGRGRLGTEHARFGLFQTAAFGPVVLRGLERVEAAAASLGVNNGALDAAKAVFKDGEGLSRPDPREAIPDYLQMA